MHDGCMENYGVSVEEIKSNFVDRRHYSLASTALYNMV